MKKLLTFCLIILLFFSIFGFLIFSNLIHEYSHKMDFKEVTSTGYICLFQFKDLTFKNLVWNSYASFYYDPLPNKTLEIQDIKEYTEKKAVFLEFFFVVLYTLCLWVSLKGVFGWGEQ